MLDNIRLIINGEYDITSAVTSVRLESSVDSLSDCLTFSIPYSDIVKYNIPEIEIPNTCILMDGQSIPFSGFVIKIDCDETKRSYTCYDACWYLTKSKECIQFTAGTSIRDCIEDLASHSSIPIKKIPESVTSVLSGDDTIYKETVYDILKKLLDLETQVSGREYFIHSNGFQILISELGEETVELKHTEAFSEASSARDLSNVKNSVTIFHDDYIIDNGTNDESIGKYGRINEIVSRSDAENTVYVVNSLLSRKAELAAEGSLKMLGDWTVKRGKMVILNLPIVSLGDESDNMKSRFVVKNVTHTLQDDNHTMVISFEQYFDVKSKLTALEKYEQGLTDIPVRPVPTPEQ